jgi:4-hydroxy-tetrahydrodipicolinate synthase
VSPRLCAEFQAACASGDFAKARDYQDRLMPLHDAMFCETNPSPVKYAVSLLGRCAPDMRLPMVEPSEPARATIRKAMQDVGLIN